MDLGFKPENCLVFEDDPSGVEWALAAGMNVVAVPDPNIENHYYKDASQTISSLNEFDPEFWALPKLKNSL